MSEKKRKAVERQRRLDRLQTLKARVNWSASRLLEKHDKVRIVSMAKACTAWLDAHRFPARSQEQP